ncbi:hypothetical protein LTR86_000551 [Recurvomyces mirabilis]|nr:hypothetical protein LTR86_000551 [Recurvomyces mirabilis]
MAPVEVVDLTLDSDDDVSPTKGAQSILSSFQAPKKTQQHPVPKGAINGQLRPISTESNAPQTLQKSWNVLSSNKKRRLAPPEVSSIAKGAPPALQSHGLPNVAGVPSYQSTASRQSESTTGGTGSIANGSKTPSANTSPFVAPKTLRSLNSGLKATVVPSTLQLGKAGDGLKRKSADVSSTRSPLPAPSRTYSNHILGSAASGERFEKSQVPWQISNVSDVSAEEATRLKRIRDFNGYHASSSVRYKSSELRTASIPTNARACLDPATFPPSPGLQVQADLGEGSEDGQDDSLARLERYSDTTKSPKRSLATPPLSDDPRSQGKQHQPANQALESISERTAQPSKDVAIYERSSADPAPGSLELTKSSGFLSNTATHQEVFKADITHSTTRSVPTPQVMDKKAAFRPSAGSRYTEEENALLARLKAIDKLSWTEIMAHFPERSLGSVQVHYSTTVKGRYTDAAKQAVVPPVPHLDPYIGRHSKLKPRTKPTESGAQPAPKRRRRGAGPSAVDGFVPWTQVNVEALESPEVETPVEDLTSGTAIDDSLRSQDRAFPSSLTRVLRQRELGNVGSRGWSSAHKRITDEAINHVLTSYTPHLHFEATSGDVTCLAWRNDGVGFAAGSIAITDDRSMQYNSSRNLLIGDTSSSELQELTEHHISRPVISDSDNPNALHSMRESQDSRLFTTVANVAYSADGGRMYTAGSDKMARMYTTGQDVPKYSCQYAIEHAAAVDILDLQGDLLATACHTSEDGSISVFRCTEQSYSKVMSFSPARADSRSSLPTFPSALRWGAAYHHKGLLLAGYSSDGNDEDRDAVGETALWNVETRQRFDLSTTTHNVFDVAWNPSSSSASDAFCVAGTPGHGKSVPGRQSVIQCYTVNLHRGRAKQVLEWDCPAYDINDVLYCPYDDNLIAAGATDGNVYIWDKRFASRNQNPMHILSHGESLNVLDHDRERELVDTGVRFLTWGATSSRLYSGSSDGAVKVWNPYRAPGCAFVEDAASFQTAVMSGALSPDFRSLLVGEERGRINLLRIGGCEDEYESTFPSRSVFPSRSFGLRSSASVTNDEPRYAAAKTLLDSKQIELRPWGAMPKRQAVQGSAYSGPYSRPSALDFERAQSAYDQAIQRQSAVSADSDRDGEDMSKALRDVEGCQAALTALRCRELAFAEDEPVACAKQRAWRQAVKRRITQEDDADYCKLDCNYFAPSIVDGVADAQASAQRIAGALQALPRGKFDLTPLDCTALCDNGLAGPCTYCPEISAKKPALAMMLKQKCQQRCRGIKAILNGICQLCSAPVNTQDNGGKSSESLCAHCSFACFRCAAFVQLLVDGAGKSSLFCAACDKGWEVGVLGYELIRDSRGQDRHSAPEKQKARVIVDAELHYYHSKWAE